MKNKAYLQISFSWLFAIIVGIFILSLTIYATTKLIRTEQTTQSAKTGKEIGILLNPLETSFETGKTTSFTLPVETRIYNKCNNNGIFGKEIIQISQKSFGKWTQTDINIGFYNKYIFSEEYVEGKKFYIFSKPFNFPFKVADLIYMTSSEKEYCFIGAPEEIKREISDLGQKNFLLENCSMPKKILICFMEDPNCDVNINYNMKYVEKKRDKMYFESNALMYAAIFADKEVYECQVKRLMQRTRQLALLYRDKAMFISQRTECHSNLNLLGLSNSVNSLSNSINLNSINSIAEDIKDKNDLADCKLW